MFNLGFKKITPRSRQTSVIITTIIIITLFFSAYSFIYIPQRQDNINEKNFNKLTKIASDINERVRFYDHTVNARVLFEKRILEWRTRLSRIRKMNRRAVSEKEPEVSLQEINSHIHSDFPEIELIAFDTAKSYKTGIPETYYKSNRGNQTFTVVEDTCWFRSVNRSVTTEYKYAFALRSSALNQTLNVDAFESFLLVKDTALLFGPPSGITVDVSDSLLREINGIKSSKVLDHEFSGVRYKFFAQPFHLDNGEQLVLCGFVRADAYQQQTLDLSGGTILLALLTVFLIALSLPILKFVFMSRFERLNIADAIASGVSVILGTAVVILIALDSYNILGSDRRERNNQLDSLSKTISGEFEREIDRACSQMERYDSLLPLVGMDVRNIGRRPSVEQFGYNTWSGDDTLHLDTLHLRPDLYPEMLTVFWADSTGNQFYKWSTEDSIKEWLNVSDRDYFTSIRSGHTWTIPRTHAHDFSLQHVKAWDTGEDIAVISMKSNRWIKPWMEYHFMDDSIRSSMIAMSTPMRSVIDPVLPMGFGFRIIDSRGNSVFRSAGERELELNLFSECDDSVLLKSAIYSRNQLHINTEIGSKPYDLLIRPIDHLPYFMVTYLDKKYKRSNNFRILSISTMLVLSFFGFICLLLVLLRIIYHHRSNLRKKTFHLDWLWPRKEKRKAYVMIRFYLLVLTAYLSFYLVDSPPVTLILIFLHASVLMFLYTFFAIDLCDDTSRPKELRYFFRGRNKFITSAALLTITIIFIAGHYLSSYPFRMYTFQIPLFVFGFLSVWLNFPNVNPVSYRRAYLQFQMMLMVITSVLPTFLFFGIAHDNGTEAYIRHGQLEFAYSLNKPNKPFTPKKKNSTADRIPPRVYSYPFFRTKIASPTGKLAVQEEDNEHAAFARGTWWLAPGYNSVFAQERGLFTPTDDSAWKWTKTRDDRIILDYQNIDGNLKLFGKALQVNSQLVHYRLPVIMYDYHFSLGAFLFWLMILIGLGILYMLIRFIVRKVFTLDFFESNEFRSAETDFLSHSHSNQNIFLVGSPFAGKSTWLNGKDVLNGERHTIELINIKRFDDVETELKICDVADSIVIDHFEYAVSDPGVLQLRLELFEKLLQKKNKKLVIVSTMHPLTFIGQLQERSRRACHDKDKEKEAEMFDDLRERWSNILGGFYKIYFPLSGVDTGKNIPSQHPDIIERECMHSAFLRRLQPEIRENISRELRVNNSLPEEEIVLRIQSMAHVYYNALWNSLSEDEQYILYDLAQDGLINQMNREIILMLLNKGIIIYRDRFYILNESFRNFILTGIDLHQIREIERSKAGTGLWGRLRTPLIIILLSVAAFILLTQKETFNSIVAFASAFTAGIPILLKLISVFSAAGVAKK